MVELFANSGDPDQMSHSVDSDLGLYCLPVTSLGVSSLQWVNCQEKQGFMPFVNSRYCIYLKFPYRLYEQTETSRWLSG